MMSRVAFVCNPSGVCWSQDACPHPRDSGLAEPQNTGSCPRRSYYQLAAATLRFKFPNPGPLDGITSTTKNILTMKGCGFQYPGSAKPQIQGASLKLCLASRVGVTGVNGAGKTTLIKMVVRESEPQTGEVRVTVLHVVGGGGGWGRRL